MVKKTTPPPRKSGQSGKPRAASKTPAATKRRAPVKKISFWQKIAQELRQGWRWIAGALLVLAGWGVLWLSLLKPFPIQGQKQLLSIVNGDNYSQLIQRWNQQDKIHLPIMLKLYQKLFIRDTLKAGVYEVEQGMRVVDVLTMLSNADNAEMNRLLIIEGTTFQQLLTQLQRDPMVKKTILNLPNDQLLKALNIPYKHPEGLFAPDTYFFAKGETDQTILKRLYQRQQKALDVAWANRAANLPYANAYEALIMASIVEKETSLDRELNQVSGVFVRRLQQGMRLQTDPTVIYGMGAAYTGNISKQDLRTPTPYNTYTQAGLPPTPIALPSSKAIDAAMHPDQSNNIYFVATGNGGHYFSASLQQHNAAVRRYLATLRAKKD